MPSKTALTALIGVSLVGLSEAATFAHGTLPPPPLVMDFNFAPAIAPELTGEALHNRIKRIEEAFPDTTAELKKLSTEQEAAIGVPGKELTTDQFALRICNAIKADLNAQKLLTAAQLAQLSDLEKSPSDYLHVITVLMAHEGFYLEVAELKLEGKKDGKVVQGVYQSLTVHDILQKIVPDGLPALRDLVGSDPALEMGLFNISPALLSTTYAEGPLQARLREGEDVLLFLNIHETERAAVKQGIKPAQLQKELKLTLLADLQIDLVLNEPAVTAAAAKKGLTKHDIRGAHRDFVQFRVLDETPQLLTRLLGGNGFGGSLSKDIALDTLQRAFPSSVKKSDDKITFDFLEADLPQVKAAIVRGFELFFGELCRELPDSK